MKVLHDLQINNLTPILVFCDNESTIKFVLNHVFHEKTKHFDVDSHFIREKVSKGVIQVIQIESDHNIVDILTKSLCSNKHEYLCNKMSLIDAFNNLFESGC